MSNKAAIFGAGTYGEVYLHYLQQHDVDVVAFLDDDSSLWGTNVRGVPVIGGSQLLSELQQKNIINVFCPIGNNSVRDRVLAQARSAGLNTPNFVHHSAIVDSLLADNSGIYILPQVVVMPHVSIEKNVMVSMGVKIAHHTTIKQGVFLSTNVSVGANILLHEQAYIGMSATLVTGKCKQVGEKSLIGAGAVVVKDVPAGVTVVGNPARIM